VSGTEHVRASVWVEQELAIASFLVQAQGRDLHLAAFVHRDVSREGVRTQIILNPWRFDDDQQVLDRLKRVLPGWEPRESQSNSPLRVNLSYKTEKRGGDRHDYLLTVTLVNTTDSRVKEYLVVVDFPAALIERPEESVLYAREESSRRRAVFKATEKHRPPGEVLPRSSHVAMTLTYRMNNELYFEYRGVQEEVVRATVFVDDYQAYETEKTIAELNEF
jgi:hypothetical protein